MPAKSIPGFRHRLIPGSSKRPCLVFFPFIYKRHVEWRRNRSSWRSVYLAPMLCPSLGRGDLNWSECPTMRSLWTAPICDLLKRPVTMTSFSRNRPSQIRPSWPGPGAARARLLAAAEAIHADCVAAVSALLVVRPGAERARRHRERRFAGAEPSAFRAPTPEEVKTCPDQCRISSSSTR